MSWIQSDLQEAPPEPYIPPSWSDGSDTEIAEALTKHYNDEIDLSEYWSVGDERIVSLNAIPSFTYNNSGNGIAQHYSQNVTMVLMNIGGKELVTPINGHTECAFIVGQKEVLYNYGNSSSPGSDVSPYAVNVRTYLDKTYKNFLPNIFQSLFKEFVCIYSSVTDNCYFAFPAEKEVFGTISVGNTNESALTQFEYFKDSSNRIKTSIYYNSYSQTYTEVASNWWLRSPASSYGYYCYVSSNGSASTQKSTGKAFYSPFGVI